MKRVFLIGLLLSASLSFAQTIPELFGKAKEQIKAGSWADASKTLDALEAEAKKPGNEAVQKQLEGPLSFYRGVCAANLGQSDQAVEAFGAFLKTAAQRVDRQGGLLQEGRRRVREGAESGRRQDAVHRRCLQGFPAAEDDTRRSISTGATVRSSGS